MPNQRRPSLSTPTYGSLTGNINWARANPELLAQAPRPVAPVGITPTTSRDTVSETSANRGLNSPIVAPFNGDRFRGFNGGVRGSFERF